VNELNNGTHNGLATFLFDDTRVSALSFQFVQETVPWARNDYWAGRRWRTRPAPSADESDLRARFDEELRRQAPYATLVGPARVGSPAARRLRR
jgi:hypothetical protein